MAYREEGWVGAAVVLFLVFGLVACGGGGGGSSDDGDPLPIGWQDEMLQLVNQERASVGAPPLVWHQPAGDVAQAHSDDMKARDFFDHVNPDGLNPTDRVLAAGIANSGIAENLARGPASVSAVMAGWLGSPEHRQNIRNPIFTHFGAGVATGGDGPYWTQLFLRIP